ncbi:hypothetical protein B6A27_05885 [Anoxybacillus sp. UARK-01]|uniref:RAMP superfamily CRISPR-associated protein n=1 Tax=Anoxybacillus sp. UARK-01 TaxID=1895648 RepID=UPI0009BA5438|nr:RAMP superfamily CRISPR-associated protein [Anoxybacillus sp. UARK-01]OQM46681.1 hypothetical protein B6A27_05885 [Anoxybacillus sp. UARK-01]
MSKCNQEIIREIILDDDLCEKNRYFKSKNFVKKKNEDKKLDLRRQEDLDLNDISEVSGIFHNQEKFKDYISDLIPGSFGMTCKFTLQSLYFSKDDDELYAVSNPVLKEKTTKIPMIKGSAWKGLLSHAALEIFNEKLNKDIENVHDIFAFYISYIRIFGTGSEHFRKMEDEIKNILHRTTDEKKLIEAAIKYFVLDLGVNIKIVKNGKSILEQLLQQIKNRFSMDQKLTVQKGRAIFYPTYFNQIDYEVINPHDREKRAGKNPIFFEVVPRGTEGIFQCVYIPFNGILTSRTDLETEVKQDKKLLQESLEYGLKNMGIGAKTKLGWGLAEITPVNIYDSKFGGKK